MIEGYLDYALILDVERWLRMATDDAYAANGRSLGY